MRTQFCSLIQSPDASEGASAASRYSTERTPITALLFEAKQKVALPVVQIEDEDEDGGEDDRRRKAGRSLQE